MGLIYRLNQNYVISGTEVNSSHYFDYEQTGDTYCITFGDSIESLGDDYYTIVYDVTEDDLEDLLSCSFEV